METSRGQRNRRRKLLNNKLVANILYTSSMLSMALFSHSARAFQPRIPSLMGRSLASSSKLQSVASNHQQEEETLSASGYNRPRVQWYPGHIAKAERQLQETFKAVDVVVEVRDARAPKATSHPMVGAWCAGRPRLVVLTHMDSVPQSAQRSWQKAYETWGAQHSDEADHINRQVQNQAQQATRERLKHAVDQSSKTNDNAPKIDEFSNSNNNNEIENVLFVNAKEGAGIFALTRAIYQAGSHVTARRQKRGLRERSLRVGIIGYPNVGKSALINRLLGRRRARTANTPGVTRSLQWIRVRTNDNRIDGTATEAKKKEFELLDSPGIIPATLVDQSDATLLAACNCIGDAAYDNQAVAAYLCEWILALHRLDYYRLTAPGWLKKIQERYRFNPLELEIVDENETEGRPMTGEDMLYKVADNTCQGNPEDAARKILQDFRTGRWGPVCLQVAPDSVEDRGQRSVLLGGTHEQDRIFQSQRRQDLQEQLQERAQMALTQAKEQGLELPPIVGGGEEQPHANVDAGDGDDNGDGKTNEKAPDAVGKGMFDGW